MYSSAYSVYSGGGFNSKYSTSMWNVEEEDNDVEIKHKRSILNRIFSPLNVGQYAIAGFTRGLVGDEVAPIEGFVEGIKGANPFGGNKDEYQHSFSDVLTDAGWQPESLPGKVAKGATGMALDIFLDPMTYVSGGLSGAVRGSGKSSVELATKGNKYLLNVDDIGKGMGMSIETAKEVVKNSEAFKQGLFVGDVATEAGELARKYNKLIGVNSKSAEVTLSLANAPFGKKIFGEAANSSKVIFTSDQVKAFGDKTFAPVYSKLRDSIYGGKIGDMFMPTHKIYKMSKNNPEEVYNFFKAIGLKNGVDASKDAMAKSIHKLGKEYLDLSPADNKAVIELLEDESNWTKIEKMVNFSETKEGQHYLELIKQAKEAEELKLEKLSTVFDGAGEIDDKLFKVVEDMDLIKKELAEELSAINKSYIDSGGKLDEYIDTVSNAKKSIFGKSKSQEEVVSMFKEYTSTKEQAFTDMDAYKTLQAEVDKKLDIVTTKGSNLRFNISSQDIEDLIPKPEGVSASHYRGVKKKLVEDGLITYSQNSKRHVDNFMKSYGDMGFQVHTNKHGEFIITHDKITSGFDGIKELSSMSKEIYDNIPKIDNKNIIDEVSTYVFGQKGMISYDTWDGKIEEVVKLIEDGRSREEIGNFIFDNKDYYTGKSKKIYEFAAQQLGTYGTGKEFKTWDDYYTKRFDKLMKQDQAYRDAKHIYNDMVKAGEDVSGFKMPEALTRSDKNLMAKLHAESLRRDLIISSFSDLDTNKQVAERIRDIEHNKLESTFKEFVDSTYAKEGKTARDGWLAFKNGTNYSLNSEERYDVMMRVAEFIKGEPTDLDKLPSAQKKVVRDYTDIVNDLLNDKYKMTFTDMLEFGSNSEQVDRLLEEANQHLNRRVRTGEQKHLESLLGGHSKVAERVDVKDKIKETVERTIKSLDDIRSSEDLYDNFYFENKEFIDINTLRNEKITEANLKYKENFDKLASLQKELEGKRMSFFKENKDVAIEMGSIRGKIREYESYINSNEAFETFMSSSSMLGEAYVEEAVGNVNKHLGEWMLNNGDDFPNTVRKISTDIRNSLIEMGAKEVDIGKLNKRDFETMMESYVPHILTPEAEKLLANDKEIIKGIENFGPEYGFGRKFNPHSTKRVISEIELNGEIIKNPNIFQINEYFEPLLKGNKMFNESMGEIFISRALVHNELMYDNAYMENMFNVLGKEFTGVVDEGYQSVMNYGKLKQFASDYAYKSTMLDKSDMISEYLSNKDVQLLIRQKTANMLKNPKMAELGEEIVNDMVFKEVIDDYIKKTFTPEVNKARFKGHLEKLLDSTGTTEAFNNLQLPFTEVSKEQYDVMGEVSSELKNRYLKNIRRSFSRLTSSDGAGMSTNEMKGFLQDRISSGVVKEHHLERFKSLVNKIDGFEKIKEPVVGQMQIPTVSKFNQARELQIIRDNNKFLGLYDKFTHFMKLNQTTVLPSFHTKNKLGNTFRSWLGIGSDILDPEMQTGAFNAVRSAGEYAEEAFTVNGKTWKWDELFEQASHLGVMDKNAFANEIGASASAKGLLNKVLPDKFDPTNTSEFFLYKAGTKVGTFTENQDRLIHFAARVKQGMGVHEAADMSQKFLFDYSDLTFFEQNVMKRIFPYYTWLRKNTPLQIEMLLDNPDKFRNVSKVLGGIEGMVDREDRIDKRFVNDFAMDWIQLPFMVKNPEGRDEYTMLNPNLPINSFNDLPDPSDMGGTFRNYFNMTNPAIKIPVEQITNRHTFFDAPLVNKNADFSRRMSLRLDHIASQFSLYNAGKGFATKRGADLGLHALNVGSGVKVLSYDYDKFKAMKLNEMERKKRKSRPTSTYDKLMRNLGPY